MTVPAVPTPVLVDRRRRPRPRRDAPMRPPVRPLDDGATEVVRVIEFAWMVGDSIQPVLMVERQLLD